VRSASPVIAVLLFQRLLKRSNIHGNLVALFLAVSWPFLGRFSLTRTASGHTVSVEAAPPAW
jgi:hypothetical protein